MRIVHVACGVIVNEQKEILVCQRGKERVLAGKWEFPGGKMEGDETSEIALKRELREELGIEIKILQSLTTVRWNYGQGEIILHPFLCCITGGDLQANEHQAMVWSAAHELHQREWASADLPIVDECLRLVGGELKSFHEF